MKNMFTHLKLLVPVAIILAGCNQSPAPATPIAPTVAPAATSTNTISLTAPPVQSLGRSKSPLTSHFRVIALPLVKPFRVGPNQL